MTRLVFYTEAASIPALPQPDTIPVWLYGGRPSLSHSGAVGGQIMDVASRFNLRPSAAAMDLVSIALSVTAADTFVFRSTATNAWSRDFHIVLPLIEPARWNPLKPVLQEALRFLSGDQWVFEFSGDGAPAPSPTRIRRRLHSLDLAQVDCVSLFSGGLDSAIGAIDLIARKRRPLLVSHATQGDATYQAKMLSRLPGPRLQLSANAYPTWSGPDDDSMRTRSFMFLALASLAGQCISQYRGGRQIDVFVCENGMIALNPPLTPRRIGSHSTRTAHPHYLTLFQSVLDSAEISVRIGNPYEHVTKGEMLAPHGGQAGVDAFAADSVSCGKWKRKNQQCGRCVPCLIRRASLHAAGITDLTTYRFPDLHVVMQDAEDRDDLIAVRSAVSRFRDGGIEGWVLQAGPLPVGPARDGYFEVARRGLAELGGFLIQQGL